MTNTTIKQIITLIMVLSVASTFIAVAIDFTLYNDKKTTKKSQKSIVATGSMIGFYLVYFIVVRFSLGSFEFENIILALIGTSFIATGAVINIAGRLYLGGNWANHIKIYDSHTLVTNGIYKIIRHPLYSSIMLMLFGGSLVYVNWLSAIMTAIVFIPFMHYRAKQEETLLIQEFDNYIEYKNKTGMFFPKLWR